MHEESVNTKIKIQEEALKLFAKRGYQAVSIRDICKQVGIKESSLYYHYKNKQALLDTLLEKADDITQQMESRFNQAFEIIDSIEEKAFCQVAIAFLEGYLLNPYVYQLIKMLSIERLRDQKAAQMYQKIVFQLPLEKQEQIFKEMILRGLIQSGDAKQLAYTYYGMIYLAFEKNCFMAECTIEDKARAKEEIQGSILDFFRRMG